MENQPPMNTDDSMQEASTSNTGTETMSADEGSHGHKTIVRLFGILLLLVIVLIAAALILDALDDRYENEMIYINDPFENIEEDKLQVEAVTNNSTELDAIESDLESLDFDSLDEGV